MLSTTTGRARYDRAISYVRERRTERMDSDQDERKRRMIKNNSRKKKFVI